MPITSPLPGGIRWYIEVDLECPKTLLGFPNIVQIFNKETVRSKKKLLKEEYVPMSKKNEFCMLF